MSAAKASMEVLLDRCAAKQTKATTAAAQAATTRIDRVPAGSPEALFGNTNLARHADMATPKKAKAAPTHSDGACLPNWFLIRP